MAGILAITVLLRYVQTRSFTIFVVYRLVLAAVVLAVFLAAVGASMEVMKQLRQRAIRDLVEQRPIRTQQELAGALRERGFRTTQATICARRRRARPRQGRPATGTQAYAIPPRLREADASGEDRIRTLLHDMPVEMRDAGSILVLKTLPGSAHPLAAAIDRARWPEVVGSIAGDDTVFLAFARPRLDGPGAPPPRGLAGTLSGVAPRRACSRRSTGSTRKPGRIARDVGRVDLALAGSLRVGRPGGAGQPQADHGASRRPRAPPATRRGTRRRCPRRRRRARPAGRLPSVHVPLRLGEHGAMRRRGSRSRLARRAGAGSRGADRTGGSTASGSPSRPGSTSASSR